MLTDSVELEGLFQLRREALLLLPARSAHVATSSSAAARMKRAETMNEGAGLGSENFTRGCCQYCHCVGTVRQELRRRKSDFCLDLDIAFRGSQIDSLDQLFVQVHLCLGSKLNALGVGNSSKALFTCLHALILHTNQIDLASHNCGQACCVHHILLDKVRLWAAASRGCFPLSNHPIHHQETGRGSVMGSRPAEDFLTASVGHGASEAEWEGRYDNNHTAAGCCFVRFTDIRNEEQVCGCIPACCLFRMSLQDTN